MSRRPVPERPGPGQESAWDYPRPPRLERSEELVEVEHAGRLVASTRAAWRVLETSHPPAYYLPAEAFAPGTLRRCEGASWCEWKGQASYFDLVVPDGSGGEVVVPRAAWTYEHPTPGFAGLAGAVAVMPALVDRCRVDGETVVPQPGGFYGGWITSRVVGPFKGGPGTSGW